MAGDEALVRRVDTLEKAVASLVRALQKDPDEPVVSALDEQPPGAVVDLLDWLAAVYLRFDGAALAPCFAWHEGVIEELHVLRGAHAAVWASKDWLRISDWMCRIRPDVVRRIHEALKGCDINQHRPTPAEPAVPLAGALAPIAEARAIGKPAPEPTDHQVEQARRLTTRTRS